MKTLEVLPSWNLNDLYSSINDSKIHEDLNNILKEAQDFNQKYKNSLINLSPNELNLCIKKYEEINEISLKAVYYAMLLHSADSSKPEHGALLSNVEQKHTEIGDYLTFFSIEWNEINQEIAEKLINSPELKQYSYFLKSLRKYKSHQLSEKEEILWQNTNLTGANAWTRFFDEILSKLKFNIKFPDGQEKELNEEQVLALLYHPDRELRKHASEVFTQVLKTQNHSLIYIFNVLLQDHFIEDKFRKYADMKSSRNLSNDIEDETVNNLIQSVEAKRNIVERFYKLKQKLLGVDRLYDYDRYAPLNLKETKQWTWEESKDFVLKAYADFSQESADIARKFFDNYWIDADLREGKRGGAFSAGVVPSVHPYILVNFTGTSRDVSTLAHELGHGIHQYLSRSVGLLNADTPLTTAETASVFGEMLVFERMLEQAKDNKEKLALLVNKIDEIFATVFRQICLTRFEEEIHKTRRNKGELTLEEFNSFWTKCNADLYGDSIELTENYSFWWSYIGHFVHSPFYCYAYSFGLLLSITLYNEYKNTDNKKLFAENYLKVLSSGGSLNPNDLFKIMNIDLKDPNFWTKGLNLVENLICKAEELVI